MTQISTFDLLFTAVRFFQCKFSSFDSRKWYWHFMMPLQSITVLTHSWLFSACYRWLCSGIYFVWIPLWDWMRWRYQVSANPDVAVKWSALRITDLSCPPSNLLYKHHTGALHCLQMKVSSLEFYYRNISSARIGPSVCLSITVLLPPLL